MIFNYLCIWVNNFYYSILFLFNMCNCLYVNKYNKNNKEKKLIKVIKYHKIEELKIIINCNYCNKEIKNEIYNLFEIIIVVIDVGKILLKKFD